MKTVGINIDGVIRDFYSQFDKQYRKVFIHNPGLVAMDEDTHSYKPFSKDEEQDIEQRIREKERELITLPVDSFELLNHYRFDSKSIEMTKLDTEEGVDYTPIELTPRQNLEKFMYDDYPWQIFGAAEEYAGAMEAVNKIQFLGLSSGLFNVVLLSSHKAKAIAATLSFLGKNQCRIWKYEFGLTDAEKWDRCDVLVDIMPAAFQTKPSGKTSVKINHLFNKWDQADYSYDHIKEIANKEFFNRVFNISQ